MLSSNESRRVLRPLARSQGVAAAVKFSDGDTDKVSLECQQPPVLYGKCYNLRGFLNGVESFLQNAAQRFHPRIAFVAD